MKIYMADGPSEESFKDILPSFSPEEIYSPDLLSKGYYFTLDAASALKLQRFRDYVVQVTGSGLLINHGKNLRRGVRSIADQLAIQAPKGETWSAHIAGKAFDISLAKPNGRYDNAYLYSMAKDFAWSAVGEYKSANFVHCDNRDLWGAKQITWSKK